MCAWNLLWPLLLVSGVTAEPTILVKEGRPNAIVVVPQKPTKLIQSAAEELVEHVEQMSGARLPVKPESSLTDAEKNGPLVAVGPTELARQSGLHVEDLPPEGYLVRSYGDRLFLLGRDDAGRRAATQGTLDAVIAFLEEDLGVRWLWPGPLGTVVPRRSTVALPPLDRKFQPPLGRRKIRNSIANVKFVEGMGRVPTDPAQHKRMIEESGKWLQRMRMGSRLEISAGHAFTDWYQKYYQDHPDYFALHLTGTRAWGGPGLGDLKYVKLCVSNPAVLAQWIEDVKAALAKDPARQCFSASPNDGYYTGHCTCDRCRAWDVSDAADRYTYLDVNEKGPAAYDYVSLSDRYTRFYNLCAEALAKAAPGKFVDGYAYGTWRSVPVREKVHENVIIGFVGLVYFDEKRRQDDLRYWNGWTKLAKRLYLRPNLLHDGDAFPAVYAHKLAADFRHCFDTGMIATDFDSLVHHWATQGLNYYVLAKLLWDPHADVDRMIDDYCAAGFGKAAAPVKQYFLALEQLTDRIATGFSDTTELVAGESKKPGKRVYFHDVAPRWYTLETLAALAGHLDAAERAAAGDDQVVSRLRFLRAGLRYAELRSQALRLRESLSKLSADSPQRAAAKKTSQEAFEALKTYYRQQAATWVIAPQLVRMLSAEMPIAPAGKK